MEKKRKLIWHIFPPFLIITLVSLAAVTLYSTHFFKNFFLKNSEKELTIRTQILQKGFVDLINTELPKSGAPDFRVQVKGPIDQLCKDIGEETGVRVTVMLPSGVVVGDSFGNIRIMENHMRRPEIREALKRKKGVSIRYSATLDKNLMYVALPILDANTTIGVIRTSISISTIDREIAHIRNNITLALVFITIVAAIVSLWLTRRLTRPIEEMQEGADRFARGNLDARLAEPSSEELSRLAITMNRMAENLDEKIKAFSDRSMEL